MRIRKIKNIRVIDNDKYTLFYKLVGTNVWELTKEVCKVSNQTFIYEV